MAGRLLKTHLPVDDNGIMVLRYPQALCRLEMTWTEAVPHVPSHDVVLYGTEGTIVVGNQVTVYTRQNREGTEVELDELPATQPNAATHFLHCIRSGQPPQGYDQCYPIAARSRDYGSWLAGGYLGRGSEFAGRGPFVPLNPNSLHNTGFYAEPTSCSRTAAAGEFLVGRDCSSATQ